MDIFHSLMLTANRQLWKHKTNILIALIMLFLIYFIFGNITLFGRIKFRPCNITEIKAKNNIESWKMRIKFNNTYNNFVVAYSLFGSDPRYTDGALANTELMKSVYPGWQMWLFHDETVPVSLLSSSICNKDHVTCINMTGSVFTNRMSWRFLVASSPFVSRYIIRDIDARLSMREKAAVDEWIASGKRFHVMRDHPSHSNYPMSGGMWGGTRDAIPDMEFMLQCQTFNDVYLQDMDFLSDIVWPIAQTSIYQHDSFSCDRFGGGHPFPTKRIGLEHVGSVYIDDKLRTEDTDILRDTIPPKYCLPN